MTLDDLVKAYHAEYPTEQHACRAGIRAVVEAMRDVLLPLISTYSWDEIDAEKWFDEILASDAERHLTPQEQDIIHSALQRGLKKETP